jgi:hypothetical protein
MKNFSYSANQIWSYNLHIKILRQKEKDNNSNIVIIKDNSNKGNSNKDII